jgi:hypothetical protein
MPIFSIVVETFQITQTRSAHTDTDYVSVTLQIGGGTATQSTCKPMGNLNNGTFNPAVGFPSVNIPEGAPVVINYLILNSSLKDSVVEPGLEQLGGRVATTSVVPLTPLVSCLDAVATRFSQEIANITNHPSCDGLVAAEQNSLTYEELVGYTNQPYFSQTTQHTGTKAPGNCNSKLSAYAVTWTIKGQSVSVTVPDVTSKALGSAEMPMPGTALYILAQNSLYGKVQTGPTGSNAQVYQQKPGKNTPTFAGNTVELFTRIAQ